MHDVYTVTARREVTLIWVDQLVGEEPKATGDNFAKYLNVMVSIPMFLKIRYKDYISQTHPIYFGC